jgi:hypothetical protein
MAYRQQTVRTCLWFSGNGHEAAAFHVSLLPDNRIEGRHGPAGGPRDGSGCGGTNASRHVDHAQTRHRRGGSGFQRLKEKTHVHRRLRGRRTDRR